MRGHQNAGSDTDNAIAFSDLALAMGVDEDELLQRLAGILSKRLEPASEANSVSHPATV